MGSLSCARPNGSRVGGALMHAQRRRLRCRARRTSTRRPNEEQQWSERRRIVSCAVLTGDWEARLILDLMQNLVAGRFGKAETVDAGFQRR
jgi:hypothetical protein